jgi:nucleoside-diphosphate-sugar epimerase
MNVRLIVGCGYVGTRVAYRWCSEADRNNDGNGNGGPVYAITRNRSRFDELSRVGVKPIAWDWMSERPIEQQDNWDSLSHALQRDSHASIPSLTVLVSVSHAAQAGVPHQETHTRGLRNLHRQLTEAFPDCNVRWIYLSTTGVYGATESGTWVDEATPASPDRPGSIAAFAAEQWLDQHVPQNNLVTLRPSGIYGPQRVPRWQAIRDQVPLQADPDSFLNLIHVDDLAQVIDQVSKRPMSHSLYCVCDDFPSARRDYYEFIASLGNWPAPIFEEKAQDIASTAPPGKSRSDGNKRIRNTLIKSELDYTFLFPSYREGLRGLIQPNGDK